MGGGGKEGCAVAGAEEDEGRVAESWVARSCFLRKALARLVKGESSVSTTTVPSGCCRTFVISGKEIYALTSRSLTEDYRWKMYPPTRWDD
jgi:hypothetical protein